MDYRVLVPRAVVDPGVATSAAAAVVAPFGGTP